MSDGGGGDGGLGGIYNLINAILENLAYAGGGQEAVERATLAGVEKLINDIPLIVTDSTVRIQGSVASVGANVDYTRDFLNRSLGAKIESISAANDEHFASLERTVVQGNRDVLEAIYETNRHMEDLFGHLEQFASEIADRLADRLGAELQSLTQEISDRVASLEASIVDVTEANTRAIEQLDTHTREGLKELSDVTRQTSKDMLELLTFQHKDMIETQKELQKEWIDTERSNANFVGNKIGELGGAFLLGSAGIATAITTGLAGVTTTLIAQEAKDALKWAPLIAQATTVLVGLTSFYDQIIAPIIKDPEGAVADIFSAIINQYYNVGKKTYDKLNLDGE